MNLVSSCCVENGSYGWLFFHARWKWNIITATLIYGIIYCISTMICLFSFMKRVGNKKKIQKIYQLHFVPIFIFYRCISFLLKIGIFFSPIFHFFQQNSLFPRPPLFFPISKNTALTKTLTHPSTLRVHTLNAMTRSMTYPKLWNIMWGIRRGSGGNAPFAKKMWKAGGNTYSFWFSPHVVIQSFPDMLMPASKLPHSTWNFSGMHLSPILALTISPWKLSQC